MARLKAIVKLDPADSNSTGGVVEAIVCWEENEVYGNESGVDGQPIIQPYQKDDGVTVIDGYEAVDLGEDNSGGVKVGWIMQDKTKVLRDPNS